MISESFRRKYAQQMAGIQNTKIGNDLTDHFWNIDTILGAIAEEEVARGLEPSVELAVYDCYSGEKYRRFQKRTEEEEERYQISKGQMPEPKKEAPISQDGAKEWEDAHKEEGIYLCEWCTKLGHRQKYNSEVCDSCHMCAECSQYEQYECSGCSYSRYRTGTPYCERLRASDVLSKEDYMIFGEIKDEVENRGPWNGDSNRMEYNDHYSVKQNMLAKK